MSNRSGMEEREAVLVVSGDDDFRAAMAEELRRKSVEESRIAAVRSMEEAGRFLSVRRPAAILLDETSLGHGDEPGKCGKPTLWAAATTLAESAPLVVVGRAENQASLTDLLTKGAADFVVRSEACVQVAVNLLERRLRRARRRENPAGAPEAEKASVTQEYRDFGEVLRHELNNPLTGILGNAELVLVELRRKDIQLPQPVEARLETIASLAIRMRETVRRLSEEWEAKATHVEQEIGQHAS